jgi:IS30 family transposase
MATHAESLEAAILNHPCLISVMLVRRTAFFTSFSACTRMTGDLMHFRRQRDILLTLQERKSRLTLARRLSGKDASVAAKATAEELAGLPASARRTITYDNGGEFARHEDVTEKIGLRAYFCDPHSRQRGGIENANGRLRRDLPRNTSLDGYTDADITNVIWNLNSTPRKCLGYQTPIEAFAANLGVALEL